jgi:pimeloyl-ACP methyl ester carboxylesterase
MPFKRNKKTAAPPLASSLIEAPNFWLMLMEGRAPWEYAASLAAIPFMRKLPSGDGHPVLVYPGLGANDYSTAPLRSFLESLGYVAYPWEQGFNFGPREGVLERCQTQADAIFKRHQRPVSLIGWSLGGIYARETAKALAPQTRSVITLGTPFTGNMKATNAWRFYQMVSRQGETDPQLIEQIRIAPPVPTTSIYSRTDGVVAWQCSIDVEGPITENIEVTASHVGMGMNPLAHFAIADRLAQDPKAWKRFDATGARRWFYPAEAKRA